MRLVKYQSRGFSIIELMIALTVGLILMAGLVTVFDTVSNMNRMQNGLARLQENGRFAVTSIKQNLEQAGYQYCIGSSLNDTKINDPVYPQPWVVYSSSLSPGMPTRSDVSQSPAPTSLTPYLVDTAYFVRGHECNVAGCSPALNSLGSNTSFAIPDVGTGDGDRIVDTDVLTFRYISGEGLPIERVNTNSSTGVVTITFPNGTVIPSNTTATPRVVIPNCKGAAAVLDVVSYNTSANPPTASALIPADPNRVININTDSLPRLFNLNASTSTISYYVANDVLDGRDIPTLYSVENGIVNPIVQGVDRFDVLYGVRTRDGSVLILDANGVQGLPTSQCVPTNRVAGIDLINTAGCGWRSVVSIEVHLLLNTIYDSSRSATEQYVYSIEGTGLQTPSTSTSEINHYKMHRREFVTSVTLKNY